MMKGRGTFASDLLTAIAYWPGAHHAALNVLCKYAGCSVYLPAQSKAERRIAQAANMMRNGMPPADVAAVLRERFGISARTAHRDVTAARRNLSAETGRTG